MVVGVGAFSSTSRGLELIPSKWRYLVPPTSGYPATSMRGGSQTVSLLDETLGSHSLLLTPNSVCAIISIDT